MTTIWKNLTPHSLTVDGLGELPPSGVVTRCRTIREPLHDLTDSTGVRLIQQDYGDVTDLPAPCAGVMYIVSSLVLNALRWQGIERDDVWAPDTGPDAIRKAGVVVGVRGLVQ